MNTKKFAVRMIVNVVTLVILTILVLLIFENTIITNDIALGQMSNGDKAYLLMEYYNKIRIITSSVYGCISTLIIGIIVYDIYKFTENKGEN